ncbi:MAG: hemerythrin domain-containing protein [Candidatus Omnitrophica bacterium]|nr:hemerythrin domain-containing protein [Candidatus Omnitrophota bacterium]
MMPLTILVKEHKAILRMIKIMGKIVKAMRESRSADPKLIAAVLDFIRTYVDRCHHGKEEGILFKALAGKRLYPGHKKIMFDLIRKHKMGRANVRRLDAAQRKYFNGKKDALKDIITNMETLARFYPLHIMKEDKVFFPISMGYLSGKEQRAMPGSMLKFDADMIHDKYAGVVLSAAKSISEVYSCAR